MADFIVRKDKLDDCALDTGESPSVRPGQALLRIDNFGYTSNNITYALLGQTFGYWKHFPSPPGWGRIPVWGFAEVVDSLVEELPAGTRVFGCLPPSSQVLVTPGRLTPAGFLDCSPSRADAQKPYRNYSITTSDPWYRPDTEALQAVLRPLFVTSYLLCDQLADQGSLRGQSIVISSASSRTAMAIAFLLAQSGIHTIGLTSPGNVDFLEGLGIYREVVAYEDLASLEHGTVTYVDIAGASSIRAAVHAHYGVRLNASIVLGAAHGETPSGAGSAIPVGPSPQVFFAPDRVAKRSQDWGAGGLAQRVADAWHPFCEWATTWLRVTHGEGYEFLRNVHLDTLAGRTSPAETTVVRL